MTKADFEKHVKAVAGGPRSEQEIAEAERAYQTKIAADRAELAAAEYEARRAPGAPPLSRLAALRATMPGLSRSIADLPEVPAMDEVALAGNGVTDHEPPRDVEMLRALGNLWVEVKKERGRSEAWEELTLAIMVNLARLVPGYGSLKDVLTLVRQLDEYSHPQAANGKRKNSLESIKRSLLMNEDDHDE